MQEKQEQQIDQGEQCLGAGVGAPGSAVGTRVYFKMIEVERRRG